MRKTLTIKGLSCANCAAKIENEVKNIEGVNSASVDFVSRRLILEIEPGVGIYDLSEKIRGIVKKIEPDAEPVFDGDRINASAKRNADDRIKKEIIKLVIGSAVFAAGVIFKFPKWLELTVFLISYVIVGGSVVLRAVKGVVKGQVFSEHFLMSIATAGAFFIGEYPEGVAVMLFYLTGELFQAMAVDRSRRSISALMDIRADHANLKLGEKLVRVSPEEVKIGDLIVVKPGERIPLDGKVIEGTSMADTSALTGEPVLRKLMPGMDALSGYINTNGVLTIEVTKNYGESTVSKILDLVQNAAEKKALTENFITKFARYYTPAVVFAAVAIALIPPLTAAGAELSEWIYRALIFLVVSCPCALVISIPLGFFGGLGGASRRGILIKGGNYLDALKRVDTVVFDKTGTLTRGVFKVTKIDPQNSFTDKEILEYAAYAEGYSNHPIALSIASAYNAEIDKSKIENYEEIAGNGVKAFVNGREILAGNMKLMNAENIEVSYEKAQGTAVYVAVDKRYAGSIVISDEVKEDAARAIRELKSLGVRKTVMLTGDVKDTADKIGELLGLDEVYSQLLPADKVKKLELLDRQKPRNGKLVFVGDGLNDAPVLARADIGIAMGGLGSDAAIEAADIVLMTDEPSKVASAIKIARKTRKVVLQNIAFALGVKLVFLALGVLGAASMWEAVFADTGVALAAVFNAMRVMNTKNI